MSVFHGNVKCSPTTDQYVTILQTQKGCLFVAHFMSAVFLCGFIHLRHAGF